MSLLSIHSLSKSFGSQTLFEDLSFTICKGDRIGLFGPNGSGKSTLLKILVELEEADNGHITRKRGLRIGFAGQSPTFHSLPIEEVLVQGVEGDPESLLTRARILLGNAQFTHLTQNAETLSGGWKKRLDVARALMHEPDILLLDEPTNHLDLEGIIWLENFLKRQNITYLVISHDRYFLDNISSKIIEINRQYPEGILRCEGSMSDFLECKEILLESQFKRQKGLTSTVRAETEWLKSSPKARTTKSESRVQRAHKLIEELSEVKSRNRTSKLDIDFSASDRQTRKLIVTNNLTKSLGVKQLFKNISMTLSPGMRLGIVGKNGTGKTTLLKILAGQIAGDEGTVKHADGLKLVYFDQHREQIRPGTSLREALAPNGDMVEYRGKQIHVHGWAKKFLFEKERLELPVERLSGGERARIQLAKLMLEPADVLFLDEPTNDLDIPTLEVIEESLREFPGAVVLITHDRCLMDRVCTQMIGLGEGKEDIFFADYSQWEKACTSLKKEKVAKPKSTRQKNDPAKKLTYKEKCELEGMEASIIAAEKNINSIKQKLEGMSSNNPTALYEQLASAEEKLETLFERWQYLSEKA